MSGKDKPLICVPGKKCALVFIFFVIIKLLEAPFEHLYFSTGQRLCLMDNEHISGTGTYDHQGYIHSSVAGIVKIIENNSENSSNTMVHTNNEIPWTYFYFHVKLYK